MCLAALVVVGVFWALVAVTLINQRSAIMERQGAHDLLVARLLGARVERALKTAEGLLVNFSGSLLIGDGLAESSPLQGIVKLGTTGIAALIAFDDEGHSRVIGSALPPPSSAAIDRWLTIAREIEPGNTRLAPLIALNGAYYAPMVCRIVGERGVAVALIDPLYLTDPFAVPELGRWARVMVVGADGVVWSRRLYGQHGAAGVDLSNSLSWGVMHRAGGAAYAVLPSALDQVLRVDGFVNVGGRGIFAVAGTELDRVLAPWRQTVAVYIGLAAVVSLLITAIVTWAIWSYKIEHAAALAMREARDAAQANSRLKSEFVTTMSHELRTPLSSIVGFAELLAEREFSPEDRRDHAKTILAAGCHLTNIVNDLLDISKIESGKMVIARTPVDLKLLVERCADLQRPAAQSKQIELSAELAPGLPPNILTDPTRLTQMITNLLGNAVKFTERGAVRLAVSKVGPMLEFSVSDTGPGIAPELKDRIFERFRQGDPALALKYGGTGLGLPLVKSLAALMGGSLRFTSEVGQGSTFTLSLPAE